MLLLIGLEGFINICAIDCSIRVVTVLESVHNRDGYVSSLQS